MMGLADRASLGMLRAVRRLIVAERRRWVDAMLAELAALPTPGTRLRFAAGGASALARDAIIGRARRWMRDRAVWAMALAAGLAVGAIDLASATRWPLRVLLPLSAGAFVWTRPMAAWRWGLALAGGVPLLALATGFRGPYAFDRADALYMVPPAMVLTGLLGWLLRRRGRPA